ncbi:carbohydrate ABC transporter permease [Chloroflexi bacterium TSY]|nr:carbohydrate ABC transporter permease [Chloroflexi bacterium TSY]
MSVESNLQGRAAASVRPSIWRSPRLYQKLGKVVVHALLILGAAVLMVPLAWMLSTSLKDLGTVMILPPEWIPEEPRWGNYLEIFRVVPFARYIRNTVIITGLDVVGKVLSCSLVAFAFARLRWRGREFMFLLMLATLMLPPQVTLIPTFVVYRTLGWIDTFLPLILPNWFGGPILTFLLRQFFMTIPRELDDAARIDGASIFGIYWRIILPLSKPALAAVAIFMFNASWNDFFGPLIYLHSRELYTLSLGLRSFQDQNYTEWHLLMAASLVAMLPVLLIFFFAQKYFIQGVVFTGIKG